MFKKRFVASIGDTSAALIAKCATHVSGFPHYSMPCLMNIFNAQTEMLADIDVQISNYCKAQNVELIRKAVKFDCTDSPGSFSMCVAVDCDFKWHGDLIFQVYWLDGKHQTMCGKSISDAFMKAGFGGGAINAIDFYEQEAEPSRELVDGIWQRKNTAA